MRFTVQRNCVLEMEVKSRRDVQDPYNDIELDLLVTAPNGRAFSIPGFWAGENVWKVRFSGETEGAYLCETRCSDAEESGLHGQTCSIDVVPYRGASPLLQRGRLRVASDRRHFENADGTPFFWIGDTWWMGLSSRLDWPHGFRTLAEDRSRKGFNVVQIVAGPYPDMDAWDPRGCNEAGHPFTEGFAGIRPEYYDLADLKIAHLAHAGIVPCIVGMWGYYLPQIGVDRAKKFWRHLVARYGAYPVVWCICGEGAMPYYLSKNRDEDIQLQKRGWTEVMRHVRTLDGYRNLITIHPTQFGRDQVEDEALMDFEMLQTGHGDMDSVGPTIASVRKAMHRDPAMPVVNSEVNYEGILGRCWQNVQRLCFYHSVLNGTAGHTYGANGIWQMSTKETPYGASPHGRCWGNVPWSEAMHLPGSAQIAWAGRFIQRFPWWACRPHPEWIEATGEEKEPYSLVSVGIPGRLRIVYMPLCWDPPLIRQVEGEPLYRARYADPLTGHETDLGLVQPDPDGNWRPPLPPECHDWILVMER